MKERDIIIDDRLKAALKDALAFEYRDLPDPEELDYDYTFSDEYRQNMKKIAKLADYKYVTVGRHRLRRAVAVALVAAMVMAATLGVVAVSKILVTWNETQNEEEGTLDANFNVEVPEGVEQEFKFADPPAPEGFTVISKNEVSSSMQLIEYTNDIGELIYLFQQGNVTEMEIALDNDDEDFHEIEVGGYKGYASLQSGNYRITWSDGVSLFQVYGTAAEEVITAFAKSIYMK